MRDHDSPSNSIKLYMPEHIEFFSYKEQVGSLKNVYSVLLWCSHERWWPSANDVSWSFDDLFVFVAVLSWVVKCCHLASASLMSYYFRQIRETISMVTSPTLILFKYYSVYLINVHLIFNNVFTWYLLSSLTWPTCFFLDSIYHLMAYYSFTNLSCLFIIHSMSFLSSTTTGM